MRKFASILSRIVISVVLLIVLFKYTDLEFKNVLGIVKRADLFTLVVALIVYLAAYILCIFRWEMLLKGADIKLSLRRIIVSFSGGIFFNLFMPSTVGGDMMRSIDLAAHTKKPKEIVATVLLDRLSGYVGLVIVAVAASLAGWNLLRDTSVVAALALITCLLIVILLVLFNNFLFLKINTFLHVPQREGGRTGQKTFDKIRNALKSVHEEVYVFRNKKRVIVLNLVLSILIQMVSPLTYCLVALSLGAKIPLIYFFIYLPIITAVTLLPISIGGLGLRDTTTVFFFAKAGMGKDLAFSMSFLIFVFIVIYAALGGIIYVSTLHHRRLQYRQSPPVPTHP